MSTDALRSRAERAAAAIIAQHGLGTIGVSYDLLVTVIAVGWLEGWQDGGDEAKAVVSAALNRLQDTPLVLRSVGP